MKEIKQARSPSLGRSRFRRQSTLNREHQKIFICLLGPPWIPIPMRFWVKTSRILKIKQKLWLDNRALV